MQQDQRTPENTQDKEIDMGVFLSLIGNFFQKIGNGLRSFFIGLYNIIIYCLIFIKQKFVWLLIAFVIGIGFGLFRYYSTGRTYSSDMIVRTNFESSRLLYNKIEYLNALVRNDQKAELAKVFDIDQSGASTILRFEVVPVDDELQKAKLYKEIFLPDTRANPNNYSDTAWSKTVKYKDFKETLTNYDYPFHTVTVFTKSPVIFSNIGPGILLLMKQNKTLNTISDSTQSIFKEQETILANSLKGIDTLRRAYNKRIAETSGSSKEGNSLILSDKGLRNPEVDIFDKETSLRNELGVVRKRALEQQDVVDVYADFNKVGTAVPVKSFLYNKLTLLPMLAVLVVFIFIEFLRFLSRAEKSRSTKKA